MRHKGNSTWHVYCCAAKSLRGDKSRGGGTRSARARVVQVGVVMQQPAAYDIDIRTARSGSAKKSPP